MTTTLYDVPFSSEPWYTCDGPSDLPLVLWLSDICQVKCVGGCSDTEIFRVFMYDVLVSNLFVRDQAVAHLS